MSLILTLPSQIKHFFLKQVHTARTQRFSPRNTRNLTLFSWDSCVWTLSFKSRIIPRRTVIVFLHRVHRTCCSSAKRENISFLLHLLRVFMSSNAKCENNSHPSHFLISLTRNNTTRMLRKTYLALRAPTQVQSSRW